MKPIEYILNSCSNEYRFGFNGQEKDQEIYNNQSTTTATFWEYDGRIGRRWNLDPKSQIFISDYAVMGNNPVCIVDPFGDKIKTTVDKYKTINGVEKKLNKISFRKADRIEITHTISDVKLFDRMGRTKKEDLDAAATNIQSEITNYWNTSASGNDGYIYKKGQKLSVKTVFETNIEVISDISKIGKKDHLIVLDDIWMNKNNSSAQMTTDKPGYNILYAYSNSLNYIGEGLFAHEWGHILGLDDIRFYRKDDEKTKIMYNSKAINCFQDCPPYSIPLPKPHYSEFYRTKRSNPVYLQLPKYR